MAEKFISMRDVVARTALSKPEIYRRIKLGTFPASIPLGRWKVVFLESDIDVWMQARIAERADVDEARRRRDRATRAIETRYASQ